MQLSEAIRYIKEKISLVDIAGRYLDLKRNGNRYTAPCPFHQETKPSFSINKEKEYFHCFGCQASGDLLEFYGRINGLDFRETVTQLAEEAGITVEFGSGIQSAKDKNDDKSKISQILQMYEFATKIYSTALTGASGDGCREYLAQRGTTKDIIEKFELGWAPREWQFLAKKLEKRGFNLKLATEAGLVSYSNQGTYNDRFRGRLIFPIRNLSGQTIAFGGRIIIQEEAAKYINSAESPVYKKKQNLYGLLQARRSITSQGCVMLTEGYMDVLTLHQFGYINSVAALGTALTEEQIKRLSGFCSNFLLIFDGDNPGRKAALRAAAMILSSGLSCRVVLLPESEDIDSLLKNQGKDAFEKLQQAAPDGMRYCLSYLQNLAPKDAVEWVKEFLAGVKIPELTNSYATTFSSFLNMEESSLRQHAAEVKSRRKKNQINLCEIFHGRDRQILICAVRYPERFTDLEEMGAEMALTETQAKELWKKLKSNPVEEIPAHLNEEEKAFWQFHRGPDAAPLCNEDFELTCLRQALNQFYEKSRQASITRAIAEAGKNADFNAQLDFLRAIQKTMENLDE